MNISQFGHSVNNLAPLIELKQWCVWRLEQTLGKTKPDKIPYNPATGRRVSTTDPATWCDHATAVAKHANGGYHGIGFIITADDPFGFVDIDGCIVWQNEKPVFASSEIANTVKPLIQSGAAWEYSQSGTGIHVIGHVDKTTLADRRKRWQGWEFYRAARFCAFGHFGWQGDANTDITQIMSMYAPADDSAFSNEPFEYDRKGPVAEWAGPADDNELIKRACDRGGKSNPDALFGGKATFAHLWNVDAHSLAGTYPPDSPRADGLLYDASSVDQALMSMLAFWTGKDTTRMMRLFQQWPGYRAEKYETRHGDYLMTRLVTKANRTERVYEGNRAEQSARSELSKDNLHAPILTVSEMLNRLYFVRGGKRGVIDREEKFFMPMEVASTYYGASIHTIQPEPGSKAQPKQVKNLNTWASDPQRRSVDGLTWLPGGGEVCSQPGESNRCFNMWKGFFEWQKPNDADDLLKLWDAHLNYLIPDRDDRIWFEQMLAFKLQYPHVQIQQWVVMFTETQGTGRGLLGQIIDRVFHGYVNQTLTVPKLLGLGNETFNAEQSQKLFGFVPEAKEEADNRSSKFAHINALNSAVTNPDRKIKAKYGAEWIEYNRMTAIICSNHADAVMFDAKDRRLRVIANPTVCQPDSYYTRLVAAKNDNRFIGAIFHKLRDMDVSTFDAGARAPMSETKRRVIEESKSEAVIAAEAFREEYQYRFALSETVRAEIQRHYDGVRPSDSHFKHILHDAGMFALGKHKRVRLTPGGKRQSVIAVKNVTRDEVEAMTGEQIAEEIRSTLSVPQSVMPGLNAAG